MDEKINTAAEYSAELFEKFSEGLSDDTRNALREITKGYMVSISSVSLSDNGVRIVMDDTPSFRRTLHLIGADSLPENEDCLLNFNGGFSKTDDGYVLVCEIDAPDANCFIPFVFRFVNASAETVIFSAEPSFTHGAPFDYLFDFAEVILSKHTIGENVFTEKERDILPLLRELATLSPFIPISIEEFLVTTFPVLRKMAEERGFSDLTPYFYRLEDSCGQKHSEKKWNSQKHRLTDEMNCDKYEPLWRDIYKTVCESQKGYPRREEIFPPREEQISLRLRVEEILRGLGYSGSYPDFEKEGCSDSKKNNIRFFIRFTDELILDAISLEFITAAFSDKKNDSDLVDILSCAFEGNGRRFCHNPPCTISLDADNSSERLESIVCASAKRAEMKKLTKDERSAVSPYTPSAPKLFFITLFILGGLFGGMMTVGFMFIEFFVSLFSGQISEFPSLFITTPWWMVFLFCMTGFGGVMGILAVVASRK